MAGEPDRRTDIVGLGDGGLVEIAIGSEGKLVDEPDGNRNIGGGLELVIFTDADTERQKGKGKTSLVVEYRRTNNGGDGNRHLFASKQ